jgi:hypothetical protein
VLFNGAIISVQDEDAEEVLLAAFEGDNRFQSATAHRHMHPPTSAVTLGRCWRRIGGHRVASRVVGTVCSATSCPDPYPYIANFQDRPNSLYAMPAVTVICASLTSFWEIPLRVLNTVSCVGRLPTAVQGSTIPLLPQRA